MALAVNPLETALVLIDLQKGVVSRTTEPHSAGDVVRRAAQLASAVRTAGGLVIYVRVRFSTDQGERLFVEADEVQARGPLPAEFSELAADLSVEPADLVITKFQWGAFYGTDLDLQLRRRGVKTIVIGGIATNFGVESTARTAWELGYRQIFVEDAMSGLAAHAHDFAVTTIFPRLGLVRSTDEVLAALRQS